MEIRKGTKKDRGENVCSDQRREIGKNSKDESHKAQEGKKSRSREIAGKGLKSGWQGASVTGGGSRGVQKVLGRGGGVDCL